MARAQIHTAWLEAGKEKVECPVCLLVLDQPTVGCPEGHALCSPCYVDELSRRQQCPVCSHPTDPSRLSRCRPLEDIIADLPLRCKNGPESAGQLHKRVKPGKEPSAHELRTELGRLLMDITGNAETLRARMKRYQQCEAAGRCSWQGLVHQLKSHLVESCQYEPVSCPNGCAELILRKDATRHASETCAYREALCQHCLFLFKANYLSEHEDICSAAQIECPNAEAGCTDRTLRKDAAHHATECAYRQVVCKNCLAQFLAGDLSEHEDICPEAQVECPNEGCVVTVTRGSMAEHRKGCGREEVECPCPGCEKRMQRMEVEQHVGASGAQHLQIVWGTCKLWAEAMEERVAKQEKTLQEQGVTIAGQAVTIEGQGMTIAAQGVTIAAHGAAMASLNNVVAGLQKRAEALTHEFTWTTQRSLNGSWSEQHTFTEDGVRGLCFDNSNMQFMGFRLNPHSSTLDLKP